MDIAVFLLARIAEDEADLADHHWVVERDGLGDSYWSCKSDHGCGAVIDLDGRDETAPPAFLIEAEASQRFSRARTECDVKRGIVERCRTVWNSEMFGDGVDVTAGTYLAEGVLSQLALPYAHHPDYCDEWLPDNQWLPENHWLRGQHGPTADYGGD